MPRRAQVFAAYGSQLIGAIATVVQMIARRSLGYAGAVRTAEGAVETNGGHTKLKRLVRFIATVYNAIAKLSIGEAFFGLSALKLAVWLVTRI